MRGAFERAQRRIESGLTLWRGIGAQVLYPFLLVQLGQVRVAIGDPGRDCAALDEGERVARASGERIFVSELMRCRALWTPALEIDARRELLARALALTHEQQAAGLTLRVLETRVRCEQAYGNAVSARAAAREHATLAAQLE
jgi:hypothetical protein